MIICREFGFDMGHMLPDHLGGCYRPHGHRYTLSVAVYGETQASGEERGMVMDYARLKAIVLDMLDGFDHRFVVARDDERTETMVDLFNPGDVVVVDQPPTAEFLASHLGLLLIDAGIPVAEIVLYETPTCSARWSP